LPPLPPSPKQKPSYRLSYPHPWITHKVSITNSVEDALILPIEPNTILFEIIEPNPNIILSQT